MSTCRHEILALVPEPAVRLRCRTCHLTITQEELGQGFCPECFEARKIKHRDFETLPSQQACVRYRCETCGLIVEV